MNMYDAYYKDCKEDQKKESKEKEFCVQVNIFCDENESKSKDDKCKDDYKKEHERKEEEFCVQVNIFCDKCKKEYY